MDEQEQEQELKIETRIFVGDRSWAVDFDPDGIDFRGSNPSPEPAILSEIADAIHRAIWTQDGELRIKA